ncbi:FecR domain-containing protein [Lysinibacillus sp. BW-2-10]|uniref:FecR domain-containing protein n=1 Tax=Lysinibacillus sp. BW-2-10 TaxID=2590030 RepID=UPI001180CFA0|nr:FecR domain-containing protein [Lysinibacillus sp. BW-2-10]TSI07369.1 hypothetical protein FJQ64_08695 [Lysinibacillus sp. BW-2-10]
MKNMRIVMVLLIGIITLAFVTPITSSAANNRSVEITDITGIAFVQKVGGFKTIRAVTGMQLLQGDRIETEENSSVVLEIADTKDIITIGELTNISILQLQNQKENYSTNLKVWYGQIYSDVTSVESTKNKFQIEADGTVFNAKGTHFLTFVNPKTGQTTMVVAAGTVQAIQNNQNNTPTNNPALVYPAQQITLDSRQQNPDLRTKVDYVSPADIIQSASPKVIEALVKNASDIQREQEELKKRLEEQMSNGIQKPDAASTLNFRSPEDLEDVKSNFDNLLPGLAKSAVEQKKLDQKIIDEVNQSLENGKKLDVNNVREIDKNAGLDPEIERMKEALKNSQQRELEEQKKLLENQERLAALIAKVENEKKLIEEANRKAQQEAAKKAEEQLKAQLSEAERKAFEQRANQREQERAQQESRGRTPITPSPENPIPNLPIPDNSVPENPTPEPPIPTIPPNNGGDDSGGGSPIDSNQLIANNVINKINEIPSEITLENLDTIKNVRTTYEGLTNSQKLLVTNSQKLLLAEEKIISLLEVDKVISAINEIPVNDEEIATDHEIIILKARDLYNTLTPAEKEIVGEAYTSLENAETVLLNIKINNITSSYYDKHILEDLRTAYNKLNEVQKNRITNHEILTNLELELIEGSLVNLNSLEKLTLINQIEINSIRQVYNRLSDTQKESINSDLVNLDTRFNELLANTETVASQMNQIIQALPLEEDVYPEIERKILDALAIYNSLSEDQKQVITELTRLNAAITKLADFYAITSKPFTDLNFINKYDMLYMNDNENYVRIPLNQNFKTINDLYDYVKGYLIASNMKATIEMDVESKQLILKPILPSTYLKIQSEWFETQSQ